MDYWVVSIFYERRETEPHKVLFATPYQAYLQAEKMRNRRAANSAYAYGVRPATWREREAFMFNVDPATGEAVYLPPVWCDEPFWVAYAPHLKDQFVHISMQDPSAIAFTEDERKGEADRQTFMRPGKYLQKFLGAGPAGVIEHGPLKGRAPAVTKQKIAFYAAWHQVGKRPESDDVLEITEDEQRMVDAYEEGPDSCMMGKGWSFENHPVRVYAGGGLALALLLSSASGEVIGRALCWPKNEVFGRVYPTPNTATERERYDELMARLKAKGWTSIEEDGDVFNGARLRKLESRYGSTLMPYLDHDYGVYSSGEWWIMSNSEPHQDNTDGSFNHGEDEFEYSCDYCQEGMHEDDAYTVYSGWRHQHRDGRPHGGWATGDRTYCAYCRDNHTFYCDGSDEHYTNDCESVEVEYSTYALPWFHANGGYTCSWSDERFLPDDETPITLANGAVVAERYLNEASFVCLWDGRHWPIDWMSEAVPGYCVNADCLDIHPIEFVYVVPYFPLEDEEDLRAWATSLTMAPPENPSEAIEHDPIVAEVFGLTPAWPGARPAFTPAPAYAG